MLSGAAESSKLRLFAACGSNDFVSRIIRYMRSSRIAGLLLVSMAALAQQTQPVEIASEPRHHLVFQNEYVRVFDVTVEPRGSTLVHVHHKDYLFVTLGDSDVVSARPGDKPVQLTLKDGETRFTAGNFAHAAINRLDRPFHNITIELLKPSTNVTSCGESCGVPTACAEKDAPCPTVEKRISSDQWIVSSWSVPPGAAYNLALKGPSLLIAVSPLELTRQGTAAGAFKRNPGGMDWMPIPVKETITNNSSVPQTYVLLEFTEKHGQ